MKKTVCSLVLALGCLGFTASLQAQVSETAAEQGTAYVSGELGILANSNGAISPLFHARFSPPLFAEIEAMWGLVGYTGDRADGTFKTGNPYIGLNSTGELAMFNYRFGAGVAIPMATLSDTNLADAISASAAYQSALGMRAGWNSWLWTPETLSLVVPAQLSMKLGPTITLAVDAAIALLIPTQDRFNNRDVSSVLQLGPALYIDILPMLTFGTRLTNVWAYTEGGDNYQLGLEPSLALKVGPASLWTRLTLPLDSPYGFGFDSGKYWGLHLGAGIAL